MINLPDYTHTSTFAEYAWNSLTEQQQFRICVKYELQIALDKWERGEPKRDIYRLIANKYGYTMERVEKIANMELHNN